MPYSQLVYRDHRPDRSPARATVIALHGNHGSLKDLMPLTNQLRSDLRIFAPEAARGVYRMREVVGHTWYGGWQVERPEPASFGDSLAQLERFIHDVRGRTDEGEPAPFLLGYDQGAVLALALATVVPDLIAGVMAVCGSLPSFADPTLLPVPEMTLPILLIADPADADLPADAIDRTAAQLEERGAQVTTTRLPDACDFGLTVAEPLNDWLETQLGH